MKKVCVIGWPIRHSRSPLIHNYWIQKYGLNSVYEKLAVEPEKAAAFISSIPHSDYIGCNVTIPHKELAFKSVKSLDSNAKRLGAVNTVYISNGVLSGTNTDGEGFLTNLKTQYPDFVVANSKVLIIGAGGAAKAIIGALCDGGAAKIGIRNRTIGKTRDLMMQFGAALYPVENGYLGASLADCDLLINTTSLGMENQPALELDMSRLNLRAIVADIVYTPMMTPLLEQAQARGNPTLGGLGMLLHQAVRGFELWFGVRPEVTRELHDLVAADVMKAANT